MATYEGTLSANILDAQGISATAMIMVEIPDTATLAQIATDVAAYVTDTDPLTQGVIMFSEIRLRFPGSGDTPADALGDVEKTALFNFNNATDGYATGIDIPDLNPGILNASNLIDLTNSDVTAWITWITTAHTAITVITKGVRALTSLKDALISFRKHRKPLTRKTKEV
jgi:hypothetical protein